MEEPRPGAWYQYITGTACDRHSPLACAHYILSFGYDSLRRNLAPGFQQ
ncbi:hypothetical protein CLOM621_06831 [Clostridium sp. M62/1]|nr:hypothetical protein CLOM621_06831 [Clostridium sp. M62/1]